MAQADIWASLLLAYSPPPLPPPHSSTCSPQLDGFPRPCLPGEWGLLLPFSQPPSPQTGFLIFKPARAIEKACIIQRPKERKGWGAGGERKKGMRRGGKHPNTKDESKRLSRLGMGAGRGGRRGPRNIIIKNSSHVLQAEPFRRLIIAPLQIWIYHQIIPCLFCKINVNKR